MMPFKRFLIPIFVLILIVVNVYLLFVIDNYFILIEKSDNLIRQLERNNTTKQEIIDQKDSIEFQELINMNTINNIDSILKLKKNKDQPLLVFRFFRTSCHSCVDSLLLLINKLPHTTKHNTLIVSNDFSANDLRLRLHRANLDHLKYAISEKLSFMFDSTKTQYFFIVDNDMLINMFFIPDIKNRGRSLNYFNYILKYWTIAK